MGSKAGGSSPPHQCVQNSDSLTRESSTPSHWIRGAWASPSLRGCQWLNTLQPLIRHGAKTAPNLRLSAVLFQRLEGWDVTFSLAGQEVIWPWGEWKVELLEVLLLLELGYSSPCATQSRRKCPVDFPYLRLRHREEDLLLIHALHGWPTAGPGGNHLRYKYK